MIMKKKTDFHVAKIGIKQFFQKHLALVSWELYDRAAQP
jgi:hypothetical protein